MWDTFCIHFVYILYTFIHSDLEKVYIMRIVQSLFQNSKKVSNMFKKCILLWQHG